MNISNDSFTNLADRIEESFFEIDSEVCVYLRDNDNHYEKLWREAANLQKKFPVIPKVVDGKGSISLSVEEHDAVVRYLRLKNEMEDVERKHIYFRGHTDNFAYLKKIGAI